MSKIHVLTSDINKNYNIVIHTPTPSGNNLVGISWQTAILNSGLIETTIMTVGTGPGQILAAEQAQILAGSVIEIVSNIQAESGGTTSASLDQMANQIISQKLNNLAKQLKYFGYTQ
jgi:hypothetical protein